MLDQAKLKNIQAEMAQKKQKQKGASMIEYALVVAAVVGIASYFFSADNSTGISKALNDKMTSVANKINS
ncbi:Flp family type IVb pilin [Hydrogenovibrio kuenenii]|uniref:Flp family type IVb pilin n=1 Tax=Hydrogenovibrio kuenenii TaxID=63658 RepID=UPI000467D53B|nr:hypothetical protein [Hydrogenovibrio kuenenii]